MKAETHKMLFEALKNMSEAARDLVGQSEYEDAQNVISMAATLDSFLKNQEVEFEGLDLQERQLVEENNRVGAVKHLRDRKVGMTLQKAVELVDAFIASRNPEIPF